MRADFEDEKGTGKRKVKRVCHRKSDCTAKCGV